MELAALTVRKAAAVEAEDFDAAALLKREITQLEERIAGANASAAGAEAAARVAALRAEINAAVAEEDFDRAAVLKKQVAALEISSPVPPAILGASSEASSPSSAVPSWLLGLIKAES